MLILGHCVYRLSFVIMALSGQLVFKLQFIEWSTLPGDRQNQKCFMFSVSDNYPFYYTMYMVLDSERQREGSNASDGGWGQPGLELVLCVPFSALTLMAVWEEGHQACRNTILLIPRGSVLDQVEEEVTDQDPGSPGKTTVSTGVIRRWVVSLPSGDDGSRIYDEVQWIVSLVVVRALSFLSAVPLRCRSFGWRQCQGFSFMKPFWGSGLTGSN